MTLPRLFLIPFAGGNSYAYRCIKPYVATQCHWSALELPGRGRRMRDPLVYSLEELTLDLYRQMLQEGLETPYVLFGHSMGGILCWLLAHHLQAERQPLPQRLILSACRAPLHITRVPSRDTFTDAEFQAALLHLGGLPPQVMADQELMRLFVPILRADFAAVDRYRHVPRPPLPIPISVLAGRDDPEVSLREAEDWFQETRSTFEFHVFSGDHFYFQQHCRAVADQILHHLP